MHAPLLGLTVLADTAEPVVRPVLGFTAYLAEPGHWAVGAAAQMLDEFFAVVPADRLRVATSSVRTHWVPFDARRKDAVRDALSSQWLLRDRIRHFFFARLADVPNVPEVGFSYTEIDPGRAARAATLEITLPPGAPPADLRTLAARLIELGPVHSLVGGFAVRWSPLRQVEAFRQAFLWTRRYLGLDLQDPETFAWLAERALPSTGWLTFVGPGLLRASELEPAWPAEVRTSEIAGGLLVQAGETPTLGDRNRLEFPETYAAVARALEPLLADPPPPFWGSFFPEDRTRAWQRRLVDPRGWESV